MLWFYIHVSKQCIYDFHNSCFFQNKMSYDIVGLSNAPDYFSIDAKSGEIKLKTDLTDDPVKQLLYVVSVYSYNSVSY